MPESMTPVQEMDVAACQSSWGFEELGAETRQLILRAALRALAEMEPTETMRGAVEPFTEYDAFLWKGLILAAASEGEQE